MAQARRLGLRITAHVAELPDHTDTAATIEFQPERYGHAVQITPALLESMAATGSAIEICPTSNLKTLGLRERLATRLPLSFQLPITWPTNSTRGS